MQASPTIMVVGRWLRSTLAFGIAALAAAGPAMAQQAPPPPAFGEVIEVRTGFVRFRLPADAPPPRAEDLEVVWKRKPQRVLRVVGGEGDPIEVGLLVDRSASFHEAFEPLRAAALSLVDHGLSSADRVFVASFTDQTRLLATGRGEAARVLAAIPSLPEPGLHPTALFDAIWQALGTFENADARAALIVVSDGCDTTGGWSRVPSVALRAREKAIPVFLLLPDRDECKFAKCEYDAAGQYRCTAESSPTVMNIPKGDEFNPAARTTGMSKTVNVTGATVARDQFSSLIADAGGGTFVAPAPEEWQRALRAIFDQLARQWTVVFEPTSEDVGSDEVKVYSRAGGRRQRLR